MKPSEDVRRWVSEIMGIAYRTDDLPGSLGVWDMIGEAITTVHKVAIPAEIEPATQMRSPDYGDSMMQRNTTEHR